MRKFLVFALWIACFQTLSACSHLVQNRPCEDTLQLPRIAESFDNVPISYDQSGDGEVALVFIHGWSCDSRYWRRQVPFFAGTCRVITLDLAGHGHSGLGRQRYTMKSFGRDVQAVVDAVQANKIILIGHSMGGAVMAEAARLMPDKVMGLVGVDTLDNVEYPLKPEELEQMVRPFERDFPAQVRQFVGEMFVPGTDPALAQWIAGDMAAAPQQAAIGAFREYLTQYVTGEAATMFEEIHVPVFCINCGLWPVDAEANRRHMAQFDYTVMKDTGHFLMLEKSDEFNKSLEEIIRNIVSSRHGI
ncbi:MAG: alpha/beta hydrolase [Deltaproteobacteria bacterium]|nr:alpha/beta hydrolase [Deltaproteobacteria bacterium]